MGLQPISKLSATDQLTPKRVEIVRLILTRVFVTFVVDELIVCSAFHCGRATTELLERSVDKYSTRRQNMCTSKTTWRKWKCTRGCRETHISHHLAKLKTRNSSRDEIANVNFRNDDIVHALQNTIDSCINSATDRYLQCRFTKFSEITQCNGHYAVQGHSRSPILVPIESSYTTSY